jgi:alcohol dehydrogenase
VTAALADLHYPARVVFGRGAFERVGELVRGWSPRALIVTDGGMRAAGLLDRLLERLAGAGVEAVVHDGVEPNPTVAQVEAGLAAGAGRNIGIIVSLGGGSAHDAAKMIALIAANGGTVADYAGTDRSRHRAVPLVAVNTTAGSGAEVSRYAVITDPARRAKIVVADRHLIPRLALEDPLLTVSLPANQTMATGLDALTHAIEATVSTDASAVSDLYAARAIGLIREHLPRAVRDGSDLDAREAMLLASMLAGYAINGALAGAVHALAHALGGAYDLPHGTCNGLLLPAVVEANLPDARERYARVAAAFAPGRSPTMLPGLLRRFGRTVGLPAGLGALGVERSTIPALTELALADLSMTTNPRRLTADEVTWCYERSL